MAIKNKKYYSITEVCEMTGLPAHKIRYFEKAAVDIQISKIRGRRYYTQIDIRNIMMKFGLQKLTHEISNKIDVNGNKEVLSKIDDLLSKFTTILDT